MEHLNNEIDTIKEQLSEPDKSLVSNDALIKSSKYPFNPNRSLENDKKLFLMTAIRKTALHILDL